MKVHFTILFFAVILLIITENSCKTYETPIFKIKAVNFKDTTKNILGATVVLQNKTLKTDQSGTIETEVDLDRFLLDRIEVTAQAQGFYDFINKVLIGKDQQETIVLKLIPKDSLIISPDTLELSTTEDQKTLKIQNLGIGSLEAIYGKNNFTWINLGRDSDIIAPTPAKYLTVSYAYDPAHQCVIRGSVNVKWEGGQKNIPVIKYIKDNGIPSAAFNVNPQSLVSYVNSTVEFDASQSTDNCQATIPLEYRWDFEGNGVFTSWQSDPLANYAYTTTGKRKVTLEVRDGAKNISSAYKNIDIIKLITWAYIPTSGSGQSLFYLGDNNSIFSDQKPGYSITLNYFAISETEITNEQYVTFLINDRIPVFKATQEYININSPNSHIKYNNSWYVEPGFEQYPVVAVTWYGAVKFCESNSCRLPTEAEWEAAARGGIAKQPFYPEWAGSTSSPDNVANYVVNSQNKIRPVKKLQKNTFNTYDMSGNVAEWCSDWYDNYYNVNDKINPQGPTSSPLFHKVIRGGSYKDPRDWITVTFRDHESPVLPLDYVGFRVVQN